MELILENYNLPDLRLSVQVSISIFFLRYDVVNILKTGQEQKKPEINEQIRFTDSYILTRVLETNLYNYPLNLANVNNLLYCLKKILYCLFQEKVDIP